MWRVSVANNLCKETLTTIDTIRQLYPVSVAASVVESINSDSPGLQLLKLELGEGEEVEASSFMPLSMKREGDVRPRRWSLSDLTSTADEGCARVIGGGSFGERGSKGFLSWRSTISFGVDTLFSIVVCFARLLAVLY